MAEKSNCPIEFEKLPLENALEESPQVSAMVKVFAHDAKTLHEYIETLRQISTQLVTTHNKLTGIYQDMAQHLKKYSSLQNQLIGTTPSSTLSSNLRKFSDVVSEMSSWQHILATQIADGVAYPLSMCIDGDFQEIRSLEGLYQNSSSEVDRTVGRYSRIRKRDPRQEKEETIEDVFKARKNFHQVALTYYSRLNQLQKSHQQALLQPILGFITANRSHHQLGHEKLSCKKSDDLLSEIGITLKGLSDDMRKDRLDTEDLITSMVSQSQLMYFPEPPGEIANLPPDTTLTSKSGFLNVLRKYMGVMSSWERQFVFIEGGNLMAVQKGEIAGTLLLELDETSLAHASDTDDRLHVFTVSSSKKSVILQAINNRERDEWILIIAKIAKEGGYVKSDRTPQSSSIFSGFGQFFAEKLQAATAAVGSASSIPVAPSSSKTSPSSATALREDIIPKNAPIVFDIHSNTEDIQEEERKPNGDADEAEKIFNVHFLGSMPVNVETAESFLVGQSIVLEVMRRILAARAIHNMFSTSHLHLSVNPSHLSLRDPATSSIKVQHKINDVAYWASHPENRRLFGYIVNHSENDGSNIKSQSFSCYVFESDENGKDISLALGAAARSTYAHLLDKKTKQEKQKKEMKILLENIATLPNKEDVPLSSDGNYLVLGNEPEPCMPSKKFSQKPESDA